METKELIIQTIKDKSILKQNVYNNTILNFKLLKKVLKELVDEIKDDVSKLDDRILIEYKDKGEFEARICIAGDVLIFHMHTNIFQFDKSNSVWKTSYLKEQDNRGYCGVFNIYNFLNDSFKYNRVNDSGYLIARIFVNNENHYIVEGKRQLGFLYNDFVNETLNQEKMREIVESAILYTLNFDLLTPPYDEVKEVTVYQMLELSNNMRIKTGKRLGFKFQADSDLIE